MTLPIRRTQAERRIQSEGALLHAAIDLIAAQGVSAVTFEALGRVGGFSRGLAGLRFGSKARLIETVLHQLHEEQDALVDHHRFDDRPGLDAILDYVALALSDMMRGNRGRAYFRLLSWSVAEAHDSRSAFATVHRRVADRFARWIATGQREGAIRAAIDPAAMAITIGGLMLGLSIQCLVDESSDADALRAATLATLRTSLAT